MKLSKTAPRTLKNLTLGQCLWAHGSIAEPEYPERLDEISRKGWGATFWGQENTVNWFHLPLPAPPSLKEVRPKLTKVFIFYHNTTRSYISNVHVYDGAKAVATFNDLHLSGNHTQGFDVANTWFLDPAVEIRHGLGISVGVQFPALGDQASPRWILFTTAGADFEMPAKA